MQTLRPRSSGSYGYPPSKPGLPCLVLPATTRGPEWVAASAGSLRRNRFRCRYRIRDRVNLPLKHHRRRSRLDVGPSLNQLCGPKRGLKRRGPTSSEVPSFEDLLRTIRSAAALQRYGSRPLRSSGQSVVRASFPHLPLPFILLVNLQHV